ncbi:MAG: Ku protein [Luteolibacter sp.]
MPRSIWKGSIAFGLVNIPVSLTNAESKPDIQLHMVDSRNHARIRYERVNADTGEEVPWDRMVKGYEYEDGQFVLLTEEDLEAVQPKLTKTIEISEFVSLDDIDPMLFEKPYYLEPDKRGRKAYALLREALRESGKAGISRVVVRTREYLSAMFVRDDALILMLLRFPQEIRDIAKLDLPASSDKQWHPSPKEMELAVKLIDEMTGKWKPEEFEDGYRKALMDYIERKVSSGDSVDDVKQPHDDTGEASGKVLDLAEYLERSFKKPPAAEKSSAASKPKSAKKHASKKVAAKKTASKKGRRSA